MDNTQVQHPTVTKTFNVKIIGVKKEVKQLYYGNQIVKYILNEKEISADAFWKLNPIILN